jgi:propionyl-CoA synthetase
MSPHTLSLRSPSHFWRHEALNLTWIVSPKTIHSPPHWFPDGQLCASHNLVTRHVKAGRGEQAAIIWDSPVAEEKRRISYAQLKQEMETAAGVLEGLGVGRGDRVLIYSQFVPTLIEGQGIDVMCVFTQCR